MVAGVVVTACSLIVDTESQQCASEAECAGRAASLGLTTCADGVCVAPAHSVDASQEDATPVDPKWGCLGSVKFPIRDPQETVLFRLRFVDGITEAGVPGLLPRACLPLDLNCTAPVSEAEVASDADGYVNIRVPKAFDGYLEIPAPASFPTMVPEIVWVSPPPVESDPPNKEISAAVAVHLVGLADLTFLAQLIGAKVDPKLASLLVVTHDCSGNNAGGVRLTSSSKDEGTVPFYFVNGSPSTAVDRTAGDGSPVGGFINHPPGLTTVSLTLVEGEVRRVGSVSVLLRSGWFTNLAHVRPTP